MTKSVLMLSVLAMASMPFAAQANLITGTVAISGGVVVTSTSMLPGDIMFANNTFTLTPAITQLGGFVALAGTSGTIQNITSAMEPTDPPDTTNLNVTDFMTFSAAPNITFTLNFLEAGFDGVAGCTATPAAAGQVCTPAPPITADQSPFNLQNLSTSSSSASFQIIGTEVDSSTGQTIGLTGTFTTPFTTMNFQQVLAEIAAGTPVVTSFSADLSTVATTTSPEPSSLLEFMMGIGLVALSVVYRKKLKKA